MYSVNGKREKKMGKREPISPLRPSRHYLTPDPHSSPLPRSRPLDPQRRHTEEREPRAPCLWFHPPARPTAPWSSPPFANLPPSSGHLRRQGPLCTYPRSPLLCFIQPATSAMAVLCCSPTSSGLRPCPSPSKPIQPPLLRHPADDQPPPFVVLVLCLLTRDASC